MDIDILRKLVVTIELDVARNQVLFIAKKSVGEALPWGFHIE